mgnify:CR=1 FL=1
MKYICTVCDFIYDPEIGDPEGGIEPGTQFEDIPDDWVCPLCGVAVSYTHLTLPTTPYV